MVVVCSLLLLALLTVVGACGEHGEHQHGRHPLDTEVELHGRRRSLLSMRGRRCGTNTPEPETMQRVEFERAVADAREANSPAMRGPRKYAIPLHVTIVTVDSSKKGGVPDATIKAQVQVLNAAYGPKAANAPVQWQFKLMDIKRVAGPSMCESNAETALKKKHKRGGPDALNLYITDLGDCGLLGYSSWPWDLSKARNIDGVVIHYDTLPGGGYKPYNLGRTAVHEIGHWMGLYHTFQNGCSSGGDQVEDTPFSATPTEGCPKSRDTCAQPGTDPISNFMDYTDDSCMRAFSDKQHVRMESMFRMHRVKQ